MIHLRQPKISHSRIYADLDKERDAVQRQKAPSHEAMRKESQSLAHFGVFVP
jgi:hypothetical protein